MANPKERTYPGLDPPPHTDFKTDHPTIEIPDPGHLPATSSRTLAQLEAEEESPGDLIGKELALRDQMNSIPRWKSALTSAIDKYPRSNVIQIATIDSSAGSKIPHNRSHIFRKLLEPDSKPHLPLVLTTTDIRTPKVDQMISNPNVEVVWWIEGEKKQWRLNGNISIIPTQSHNFYRNFKSQWEAHRDLLSGLDALRTDSFDWEAQRLETFKSFSSHMKASFCRPVPGSKLQGGPEEAKKWPQTVVNPDEQEGSDKEKEENKKNWDYAFGNFALVVIDPLEVDYLDMDVVPNRRWRQWIQEGRWVEEEIVP